MSLNRLESLLHLSQARRAEAPALDGSGRTSPLALSSSRHHKHVGASEHVISSSLRHRAGRRYDKSITAFQVPLSNRGRILKLDSQLIVRLAQPDCRLAQPDCHPGDLAPNSLIVVNFATAQ